MEFRFVLLRAREPTFTGIARDDGLPQHDLFIALGERRRFEDKQAKLFDQLTVKT